MRLLSSVDYPGALLWSHPIFEKCRIPWTSRRRVEACNNTSLMNHPGDIGDFHRMKNMQTPGNLSIIFFYHHRQKLHAGVFPYLGPFDRLASSHKAANRLYLEGFRHHFAVLLLLIRVNNSLLYVRPGGWLRWKRSKADWSS